MKLPLYLPYIVDNALNKRCVFVAKKTNVLNIISRRVCFSLDDMVLIVATFFTGIMLKIYVLLVECMRARARKVTVTICRFVYYSITSSGHRHHQGSGEEQWQWTGIYTQIGSNDERNIGYDSYI